MQTQAQDDFNEAELLAEHQAEKAVAEAKAQAEQEAKWEADRIERDKVAEIARTARNKERSITLHKIAGAVVLRGTGNEAEVIEADGKLLIDGVDTAYYLDFVQERSHQSSWRSTPNGKMRLTVGDYGDRVSFPQRKNGSHNYDEIARLLIGIAARKNAAAKAEDNRRGNKQTVAGLAAELFPNDKNGYQDVVTASSDPQAPIRFSFKIDRAMSIEQARALAVAIRSAGIKLHYAD